MKELVEPPLNTIAWISNISTGLPKALRKPLEASFLSYLAGAGLDAAMVDILDEHIRKTLYLIKSFRDEIVFSQTDIA
jgi:cobalamin-dependent methionine synthase I